MFFMVALFSKYKYWQKSQHIKQFVSSRHFSNGFTSYAVVYKNLSKQDARHRVTSSGTGQLSVSLSMSLAFVIENCCMHIKVNQIATAIEKLVFCEDTILYVVFAYTRGNSLLSLLHENMYI